MLLFGSAVPQTRTWCSCSEVLFVKSEPDVLIQKCCLLNQNLVFLLRSAVVKPELDVLVLGDHEYVTTLRKIEPYKPVKTQEPIQMSKMPDAHKCDGLAPIERDYWPAPPAAAAAYPDLCKLCCIGRLLQIDACSCFMRA